MTRILIVEDHPESRYLLERLLTSRGRQVIAAENGQEALRLAQEDRPDVIISDIMMPVMRMAGYSDPALTDIRISDILMSGGAKICNKQPFGSGLEEP